MAGRRLSPCDELLRGAVYRAIDCRDHQHGERERRRYRRAVADVVRVHAMAPLVVANRELEQAEAELELSRRRDEAAELAWYAAIDPRFVCAA